MSVLARLGEAARAWRRAVGAGRLQHLGGVLAGRDGEVARVVAAGGELPEDPLRGLLPGGVGVGGDDDARSLRRR